METTIALLQGSRPALDSQQSLGTGEVPNGLQDVASGPIPGS